MKGLEPLGYKWGWCGNFNLPYFPHPIALRLAKNYCPYALLTPVTIKKTPLCFDNQWVKRVFMLTRIEFTDGFQSIQNLIITKKLPQLFL